MFDLSTLLKELLALRCVVVFWTVAAEQDSILLSRETAPQYLLSLLSLEVTVFARTLLGVGLFTFYQS